MILRETQNQNDADDAESGIWYRDVLKTASRASSASPSSRRAFVGGLGYTPEMRLWISKRYACKTRPHPKTIAPNPYTHTNPYIPQSESAVIHPKILTRKSESVLIHSEKISQITVLSHSYIIDNCKTNSRNIQNRSRICQTESSKCGIGIWTRS